MIFSCKNNIFNGQMKTLETRITDELKKDFKQYSKVHIFVLFLTRVLLMRLNEEELVKTLRKLWPHLLNELISIFELKESEFNQDRNYRELAIEAIKLIELLASLNIEDF